MSKIAAIINQAKEFSRTPAGKVASCGLSYIATMAILGPIVAKFSPAKATFARALGMGIYSTTVSTIVGTIVAGAERNRAERLSFAYDYNDFLLHRRIEQLQYELDVLEGKLAAQKEENSEPDSTDFVEVSKDQSEGWQDSALHKAMMDLKSYTYEAELEDEIARLQDELQAKEEEIARLSKEKSSLKTRKTEAA